MSTTRGVQNDRTFYDMRNLLMSSIDPETVSDSLDIAARRLSRCIVRLRSKESNQEATTDNLLKERELRKALLLHAMWNLQDQAEE